ncbi:CpsD/CapB family tyrosine-protein kinase [Celeribacter marinus]|uniref:CpsD/CapB family tyrosine-protein kinase n=1 Tax=Celeribacter marinus TaxID=1397108 RepID=UPI00317B0EC8
MENLQIAIEKARASREEQTTQPLATSPLSVEHSWHSFPELAIDPAMLIAKRVTTQKSNAQSSHYDMLRTRIRDQAKKNDWRRIAIVSAGPQVGKTTTLANLAFSFARLPYYKTMVFDFDLRRPSLQHLIGHNPSTQIDDVVAGKTPIEAHCRRIGDNLAFSLNAQHVANSAELLQSDGMSDFLSGVQETYDPELMLFDTPPLLAADDTRGFLSNVDAALLIVEAERTPIDQIDVVEQQLSELTNVLGVVLNKCNYPDPTSSANYAYY